MAAIQAYRLKPKFCFLFISFHMHVDWFVAIAGVEEKAVRAIAKHGGHYSILGHSGRQNNVVDSAEEV